MITLAKTGKLYNIKFREKHINDKTVVFIVRK